MGHQLGYVSKIKCNCLDFIVHNVVNIYRRDPVTAHTKKPKATRHLYLVRHGQFNNLASEEKDRALTFMGINFYSVIQ